MKSKDKVEKCIIEYMEEHQYSPSIRELCQMTGLNSTSSVYWHLKSLEKEGRIIFDGVRCIAVMGYQFCKDDTEK